jgi:hypothetical protein
MPRDPIEFEDADDEFCDDEYPEEDDSDDDLTETVSCPECGAEIYEDASQCPVCGSYVTSNSNVWSGRSLWWILLGLLGLIVTTLALAGLMPQ